MLIRPAHKTDIETITEIFNFYIANTNARFEESPLTIENRLEWFNGFETNPKYAIFAAELEESLVGFACSQQYRPLSAFDDTVEVTIYMSPNAKGHGVGSALYRELLSELSRNGVHRALSGIALPNDASIALHKKFGFEKIGIFNEYARKHGDYISSIWMEKRF